MPHVIVKLWPGKSEEQKRRLAEAITRDIMHVLSYGEESVSVALEEIKPEDWAEEVYPWGAPRATLLVFTGGNAAVVRGVGADRRMRMGPMSPSRCLAARPNA